MATKVAQGTGTNDAAGTTLAASAVSVLKGDIICAQVGFEAVAGTAFFSDGSANVWPSPNTPTTTQDNAAVLFGRTGWTRAKVDNAALIVTANTPNGTFRDITLLVFRPAAGMQLTFRAATSAQGSSTALASGAITTAPGATAGFYLWESGGTFTISGGFTAQNSSSGDTFDGYQLGTSGSQNATASGTISTRWVAHILNFVETPLIATASRQRSPSRRGAGRDWMQPARKAFSAAAAPPANLTLDIDTAGSATFAGQSITMALGLALTNGSATFQGQAVNVSLSVPLTAGSATFQGQSVTFSAGLALAAGSATFAGQSVNAALGVALAAGSATFQGQDVTLNAGGNLTLDVEAGAATFTGQPVTFTLTESTVQLGGMGPMSASIGWYDHRKRKTLRLKKIAEDATEIAPQSAKVVLSDEALAELSARLQALQEEEEAVMLFLMLQ